MISSHTARRLSSALAMSLFVLPLAGCQGDKIVAQLKSDTITQSQYLKTMQQLNFMSFQQEMSIAQRSNDPNLTAGGIALISLLTNQAIGQMAQEQNLVPSDQIVDQLISYQRLHDPQLNASIKDGKTNLKDLRKQLASAEEVVFLGAGSDGSKIDTSQLQTLFDSQKGSLDIPARIGVRMLAVKDQTDGITQLNSLKAGVDFHQLAIAESSPSPYNGTEQYLSLDALKNSHAAIDLYQAIVSLSDNQFANAPVALHGAAGAPPLYVDVQVTQKIPAHKTTLDEVRPFLITEILQQQNPELQLHFLNLLHSYLQDAVQSNKLQVYIPSLQQQVISYLLAPPPNPNAINSAPQPGGSAPPSSQGANPNPQSSAPGAP